MSGDFLQIEGVRGPTGGLLGTAGIPVGRLQGYYRGLRQVGIFRVRQASG